MPFPCVRMLVKPGRPPWIPPLLIVNHHVDMRVGAALEPNICSFLPNHSQAIAHIIARNINSMGHLQFPHETLHSARTCFGLHMEHQDRIFWFHLVGENLNCRGVTLDPNNSKPRNSFGLTALLCSRSLSTIPIGFLFLSVFCFAFYFSSFLHYRVLFKFHNGNRAGSFAPQLV